MMCMHWLYQGYVHYILLRGSWIVEYRWYGAKYKVTVATNIVSKTFSCNTSPNGAQSIEGCTFPWIQYSLYRNGQLVQLAQANENWHRDLLWHSERSEAWSATKLFFCLWLTFHLQSSWIGDFHFCSFTLFRSLQCPLHSLFSSFHHSLVFIINKRKGFRQWYLQDVTFLIDNCTARMFW